MNQQACADEAERNYVGEKAMKCFTLFAAQNLPLFH
jgi:hypothetical protein